MILYNMIKGMAGKKYDHFIANKKFLIVSLLVEGQLWTSYISLSIYHTLSWIRPQNIIEKPFLHSLILSKQTTLI